MTRFIAVRPADERTTKLVEQESSSYFGAYSVSKAMNDLSVELWREGPPSWFQLFLRKTSPIMLSPCRSL